MTDLHCHLLTGIDDGARDCAESLTLLSAEREDGVERIALTSHYNPEAEAPEAFIRRREAAFSALSQSLAEAGVPAPECKCGAEVMFSPLLGRMDAEALCIEGTRVLLLELPVTHRPYFLDETLFALQEQGITPLLAHVERYSFVMEDPGILYDWTAAGILSQVNAGTLIRARHGSLLWRLLDANLVQIIASDAHSPAHRPPNLAAGLNQIRLRLGEKTAGRIEENSDLLFSGREVHAADIYLPRRIFGFWR